MNISVPALEVAGTKIDAEIVGRYLAITVRGAPSSMIDMLQDKFASWQDLAATVDGQPAHLRIIKLSSSRSAVYLVSEIVWL